MNALTLAAAIVVSALVTLAGAAQAATFVYVSNAEDGTIGTYTLEPDGTLRPGPRVDAGKVVMPMSVSPDKRFLYAGLRSKPYTVITYAIDRATGALKQLSTAPLAESFPYIHVDKTGRLLRLVGSELDITERKLYEDALFREKESAQITLQSIGDGVITTDQHSHVEYINPVAEELTGWRLEDSQ